VCIGYDSSILSELDWNLFLPPKNTPRSASPFSMEGVAEQCFMMLPSQSIQRPCCNSIATPLDPLIDDFFGRTNHQFFEIAT
jgi:hypothetical protein